MFQFFPFLVVFFRNGISGITTIKILPYNMINKSSHRYILEKATACLASFFMYKTLQHNTHLNETSNLKSGKISKLSLSYGSLSWQII